MKHLLYTLAWFVPGMLASVAVGQISIWRFAVAILGFYISVTIYNRWWDDSMAKLRGENV